MLIKQQVFQKKSSQNNSDKAKSKTEITNERYISPEKRQYIIDELILL